MIWMVSGLFVCNCSRMPMMIANDPVDASVTQSALEEALASRMQDGTIGSRMSVIGGTIGHAFRSRYLPKPNRQ